MKRVDCVRALVAAAVLLFPSSLLAMSYVSVASGNWSTPATWLPTGVPGSGDTVTITGSNYPAVGVIEIASTAPGVFAANADGRGVPAALALRIAADGSQKYESAFDYDGTKFVARLLDLGPESDQLILVLFGTGLRHYKSRSAITVNIGGIDSEVLYVGPQGGFVGLDQVNVRISRRLLQRGEVDVVLMVDGQSANVMKVNVF